MQNILESNALIAGLVRTCFGVEPDAMAALARNDAQVQFRQAPAAVQEPTALDGIENFLRRTVAISLAIRGRTGPVRLLTEQQADAQGWPCARLADMATVLAWALVLSDGLTVSVPVPLEADATADDHGRVSGSELPALADLLDEFYKPVPVDSDAVSRADENCPEASSRGCRHVRLDELVQGWFGVDVLTVELSADRYTPRLVSANARAVALLVWVITQGLELGSAMRDEMIEAARVKTAADARIAGEPGVVASNTVLLLASALQHGSGWTPDLLAPRECAAVELTEATWQVWSECGRAGGGVEARVMAYHELRDHVARNQVHIGRQNVRRVAWRLVDADA